MFHSTARNQVTDFSFFILPCTPPASQNRSLHSLSLLISGNWASHAERCQAPAPHQWGQQPWHRRFPSERIRCALRAHSRHADSPALPSYNTNAKGLASLWANRAHRFSVNKASRCLSKPTVRMQHLHRPGIYPRSAPFRMLKFSIPNWQDIPEDQLIRLLTLFLLQSWWLQLSKWSSF